MPRLESSAYLQHLHDESARFRAVLTDCAPSTAVPSCPGWDADDLLFHLARVQHAWAWGVTNRPRNRDDYEPPVRPGTHDELLALFDKCSGALLEALAGADPADEAWTWSTDHTVGFVVRRQALEALVHRVDAEQTAGAVTAMDPALAADGVEEILDVMYGGVPPWGDFSPLPHFLRVDCTDTVGSVWVQLGRFSGTDPEDEVRYDEDDICVVGDPGVDPDAVISGGAEALLTRLWRRSDGADIHLAGDLAIVDRFRSVLHQPLD
jgi:uncharacterized protein (TIGR03083 family)